LADAVLSEVSNIMNREEFVGRVEFFVSAGIMPWHDPAEYVHEVTGKAFAVSDSGDELEAGEITLKLVSVTEATNRGIRLLDVCDADSGTLEAVYSTLFDATEEMVEELDIEPSWNDLIFIDDLNIAPEYADTSLRVQLIETSLATFGPNAIVVAVEESLALTVEDWRELGFKRIAKSPFVFRDQLKLNPYGKTGRVGALVAASYICDSCGEEIDIALDFAAGSHQEYVEDCPVCCRPNVIHVEIDDDGEFRVWTEAGPEHD
jgi:hypothetical protein